MLLVLQEGTGKACMESYKISKDQSNIIKGIAILLMLVHHGFTFPEWIEGTAYQPDLFFVTYFREPTRICVSLFAFVTGWSYALADTHSWNESGNKIKRFLVIYWIVCIPALLMAAVFCGYRPTVIHIATEMLGLSDDVMIFCWYVAFYIVSMLLLPWIYKFWEQSLLKGLVTGVILPIAVFTGFLFLLKGTVFEMLAKNLRHWFPCIAVGYLCNRYNLFSFVKNWTRKIPPILLLVVGVAFCGIGRYFFSAIDFVYCAVFVFAIANCTEDKENLGLNFFKSLGTVSTNIWFLHCLIYNSYTGHIFQLIFYSLKSPLFIMGILVLVLYAVSYAVTTFDGVVSKLLWHH